MRNIQEIAFIPDEFSRHGIAGPVSGQPKSNSAEVTGNHPERLIKPWTR